MSWIDELDSLCERNGGMLDPVDVVRFAEDPDTDLHSKFEWDDGKAASEYRLWQARHLIREVTVIIEGGPAETVRAFVSLKSDRSAGGYRRTMSVLTNEQHRQQLLDMCVKDIEYFKRKYSAFKECAEIIDTMNRFVSKRKRKRKPAKELAPV